jgi:hypothetical protein
MTPVTGDRDTQGVPARVPLHELHLPACSSDRRFPRTPENGHRLRASNNARGEAHRVLLFAFLALLLTKCRARASDRLGGLRPDGRARSSRVAVATILMARGPAMAERSFSQPSSSSWRTYGRTRVSSGRSMCRQATRSCCSKTTGVQPSLSPHSKRIAFWGSEGGSKAADFLPLPDEHGPLSVAMYPKVRWRRR